MLLRITCHSIRVAFSDLHTNAWAIYRPVTQQSSAHARNRTSKHERTVGTAANFLYAEEDAGDGTEAQPGSLAELDRASGDLEQKQRKW